MALGGYEYDCSDYPTWLEQLRRKLTQEHSGDDMGRKRWHIDGFGGEYVSFSAGEYWVDILIKSSIRTVEGRMDLDVMDRLAGLWLQYRQELSECNKLTEAELLARVRGKKLGEADQMSRKAMIDFLLEGREG